LNGEEIKRVSEVMTDDYILVDGLATVSEAVAQMKAAGASCMIVRKRHEDDEYGILQTSDIAKHVIARNRSPDRVNVYEIMAKPVISVRPSMDVRYTARMFENFGLSMAPVLHSSEVLGVVSYESIVLGTVGVERPALPPPEE
jgi:signal-transduction protein with cAMP-binding, CBS, and nucleotidyltransferase domain